MFYTHTQAHSAAYPPPLTANGVDLTGLLGGHKGRLGDGSPLAGSGAEPR